MGFFSLYSILQIYIMIVVEIFPVLTRQWYTSVPVYRNIFGHNMGYRILNKLSRYLQYIYIQYSTVRASTNMGKHCLQLVLTLLLLSAYARRFSEQTDEKNPCWAVFSIIFKMADTTNACMLPTRLVICTDFWAHEQDTRRCCYAMLLCIVSYRDNCIWIRIIIIVEKIYCCRPSVDHFWKLYLWDGWKLTFWHPFELLPP